MNRYKGKDIKGKIVKSRYEVIISDTNENIFNFMVNVLPDNLIINAYLRPVIARMLGLQIGRKCQIRKDIYYESHKNLQVGANVFLNRQSYLDAFGGIFIGNSVRFGPRVVIITGSHEVGDPGMRAGETIPGPCVIEDGCWIGANVTIFPGITIGKGSIISAGSVVQRSMPPNYLISGHPARPVIKLIEENGRTPEKGNILNDL